MTEPKCGDCGGVMTPHDSKLRPELFLHDACLPEDLRSKQASSLISPTAKRAEWDDEAVRKLRVAVDRTGEEWLQSFTGAKLFPFACLPDDLHIEDIAHSLSLQCRFRGMCREFYSVAQHSLYVSDLMPPELQGWGLLHDVDEVIFGDNPTPIKRRTGYLAGGAYDRYNRASDVELTVLSAAATRFKLPKLTERGMELLYKADATILATEVRDLMGGERAGKWTAMPKPLEKNIEPLAWQVAEEIFLVRAKELGLI